MVIFLTSLSTSVPTTRLMSPRPRSIAAGNQKVAKATVTKSYKLWEKAKKKKVIEKPAAKEAKKPATKKAAAIYK